MIDSFLKSLNKDSWEIKTLGEIAVEIYTGNGITKNQLNTGNYPAVKNKDISDFDKTFEKCLSYVDPELIRNKKYTQKGDLLISNMNATKALVGKAVAYLGNEKCLVGNHVVVIKHNENPIYLTYALGLESSRKQIEDLSQQGTVCDLYLSSVKKIEIPLPSLEIQNKIVDFLEKYYKKLSSLSYSIPKLIKENSERQTYYKNKIFEI